MNFLKYTNGLILGFFALSLVGLWISFSAFVKHNYFRITLVVEIIALIVMLFSVLLYVLKKDDGLFVWFSGFSCTAWVFSDVIWVLGNGFNLVDERDTMLVSQIENSSLYYMMLALAFLFSIPVAKVLSNKIGKNNTDKLKQSLGSLITLIVAIAVPSVMRFLEEYLTISLYKYFTLFIGIMCAFLFQAVGFAFVFYRKSIRNIE